jgi:23S rRNA (cytidine1920-2'-O)/16S rRNA (cytidine1409-2'-O)-methyltransferase
MGSKSDRRRLDQVIMERGIVSSRQRAQALIMAGKVLVDGTRIDKPGREVHVTAAISIEEDLPYVSRGGLKLSEALDHFKISPKKLVILDAGASTGGFTDCLLQRGASKVIAVDVGYGQLDWKLRTDPRVIIMERTNIRFLEISALPCPVDAAVADLSFISLRLVLPKLEEILPKFGWLLALVKPQFEVGRTDVGKGGVVKDLTKIRAAVDGVKKFAIDSGFQVKGELESSTRGPKGNRESFLHLVKARD